MLSKYFKFTNQFMDGERDGLLKYFPFSVEHTYEILKTEYISDDDNTFGITKIKCVETGEMYDIGELHHIDTELSHWCFLLSDFKNEYETVEL